MEGDMYSSENRFKTITRRDFLRLGGAGLAGATLLGTAGGRVLAQTKTSLEAQFETAARKYNVPVELLLAMGYYNTLWEMPPPSASAYRKGDTEGRGDYGIMQLTHNPSRNTLGKAAKLTGLSKARLKNDRSANIEGGAALLSDLVGKTKPKSLDGWQEALTQYADTDLYASQVYGVLREGASTTISTGERLKLSPQDVEVPRAYTAQSGAPNYPQATWRPAAYCNYTKSKRESSYDIEKIVIHVAEGSYSGTISWLENCAPQGSAHYVVSNKGWTAQCVREEDIAWHAGWWYTNKHSIGIEHAGYVDNPEWFTKSMYHTSAKLSAWCCKKYKIPIDREHIIGHDEVPGCSSGSGGGVNCHTDPGSYWDWKEYMLLVYYFWLSSLARGQVQGATVADTEEGPSTYGR
jgi:N-acetyl-anhydromuramyl-L-alanine amidase AmpD